ncbi:MAG TPA: hypothetical protein VMB05_16635 [Solirubrobacteraceae bacterium]|nr:hypothetical protein [Solirubrobacteraceae bacterium]
MRGRLSRESSEASSRQAIRHNARMSVTRVAWLVTVLIALLTGLLLLLAGYNGYAGLGLAVAIAAAINLR